jgi:hypothetical protein
MAPHGESRMGGRLSEPMDRILSCNAADDRGRDREPIGFSAIKLCASVMGAARFYALLFVVAAHISMQCSERNRIMKAINWLPATALTIILGIVLTAVQFSAA